MPLGIGDTLPVIFHVFEVKFPTLFDVLAECRNWRHLPSRTERLLSIGRWVSLYRRFGLSALVGKRRSDRGQRCALSADSTVGYVDSVLL